MGERLNAITSFLSTGTNDHKSKWNKNKDSKRMGFFLVCAPVAWGHFDLWDVSIKCAIYYRRHEIRQRQIFPCPNKGNLSTGQNRPGFCSRYVCVTSKKCSFLVAFIFSFLVILTFEKMCGKDRCVYKVRHLLSSSRDKTETNFPMPPQGHPKHRATQA